MKTTPIFEAAVRINQSNYFIDELGVIYSNFNTTGRAKAPVRIIKQHIRNGYPSVRVNIDGTKIKHHTVHRIMANTFLVKPENMDQVNHINGIKTDNSLSNLEWSNASLNMSHAYKNNLMTASANRKGFKGDLASNSIAVIEFNENGEFVKRHESLTATKDFGFNPVSVRRNCNGVTEIYKGRKFRFEIQNDKPVKELQFV